MFIVTLFMLLAPGLIAVRILWHKREIRKEDYKLVACDFIIYTFLIHTVVFGFIFLMHPERSLYIALNEFRANVVEVLVSSFVFRYSVSASLVAALILPVVVPFVTRFWTSLDDRKKKRQVKNKTKNRR